MTFKTRLISACLILAVMLLLGCAQAPQNNAPPAPSAPQTPQAAASVTLAPSLQATQTPAPSLEASATPTDAPTGTPKPEMQRGTPDSDFVLEKYDEEKAFFGTTIFPDNHVAGKPRIVEVNMLGEIVWEYVLPSELAAYTNPGFDVEPLANGNVLFVAPGKGVYEINRAGSIVWSYVDAKVSHDADRLANGRTLVNFGNNDAKTDAQVKEIDANGRVLWSWKASSVSAFNEPPYASISEQGWTHANAVLRLANGNTLVSLRNFDLIAEINADGELVRTIENEEFRAQHDPSILGNGNILLANHANPNSVLELTPDGKTIVWKFELASPRAFPARDANKLPNGNVLVTGADRIFEITPEKEVVWMLRLGEGVSFTRENASAIGFFKAERLAK